MHAIPDTKFLFKKCAGISTDAMTFYFYCPSCMCLLAECGGNLRQRNAVEADCSLCTKTFKGKDMLKNGSFFVSLPIQHQLESLLSAESTSTKLQTSLEALAGRRETGGEMKDVTDGALYINTREALNCSKGHLTVTLNSDGSPLFNSSKHSIWPVQLVINELPPSSRLKNTLVSMLWYGPAHPDMTLLLQAFTDQMRSFNNKGVTWHANGKEIHSKVPSQILKSGLYLIYIF